MAGSEARRVQLLADVYLEEDEAALRFGNAELELTLSKGSGSWLALTDRKTGLRLAGGDERPAMLLRTGGRRAQPKQVRNSRMADLVGEETVGAGAAYEGHAVTLGADAVTLAVSAREGDWVLTDLLTLRPGQAVLRREFVLRYEGQGEVLLRDVRLLVPGLALGEEAGTTVEAPGYPTRCHVPLAELPPGIWGGLDSRPSTDPEHVQHSVDVPGSAPGLVGLTNPALGLSLLTWVRSKHEFCLVEVERRRHGLDLTGWVLAADRFRHGHALRAGAQTIALRREPWRQAMAWFQSRYEADGFRTPRQRPSWARQAVIYEVHVGSAPFLGGITYEPYPRVRDLIRDLPRIAGLGFNTIQLMPHWPFCGYTVTDYYDIDHSYGDEAEVRELMRVAHTLGLRVILDIVLHGCVDQEIVRWDMAALGPRYDFIFGEWLQRAPVRSRYRDEHPEWFMRDEDGEMARIYTWAFDAANPAWQDFIVDVLTHYVRDLGADGFRFDAPTWNCMPNWDRGLPYRPSASLYGADALFVKVRRALRAIAPDILLYTEPSGPLFRRTMDLNYNYDEEWVWGSLVDVVSPRGYAGSRSADGHRLTARELSAWLECRRLALPEGSLTVHHLDSHDTFWWGEKAQFRSEAFGQEAARALYAVCACLDGALMSYVGSERGSESFFQDLLGLRARLPELCEGDCDYTSVECDDEMVLALLRHWQGQCAVPLINLANREAACRIGLPMAAMGLDPAASYTVWDALNGRLVHSGPLGELQARLGPYGVAVWVIRQQCQGVAESQPAGLPCPERDAGSATHLRLRRRGSRPG